MASNIQAWLDGAGRYPLLSKAEEVHLGTLVQRSRQSDATPREIRAGARARDRFIRCNLRLVVSNSRAFLHRLHRTSGLDHEDLLQEGVVGLTRGVEKFDPTRGYAASTYFTLWIRQAMGRLLQQQGSTVYIPNGTQTLLVKAYFAPPEAKRTRQALQGYLEATDAEMARFEQALLVRHPTSLDQRLRESDERSFQLVETIADSTPSADIHQLDLEAAVEALRNNPSLADELALLELHAVEGTTANQLTELTGTSRQTTINALDRTKRRCAHILQDHRNLVAA